MEEKSVKMKPIEADIPATESNISKKNIVECLNRVGRYIESGVLENGTANDFHEVNTDLKIATRLFQVCFQERFPDEFGYFPLWKNS